MEHILGILTNPLIWAVLLVAGIAASILSGCKRRRLSKHGRRRRQAVNIYRRVNEIGAEGNTWLVNYLRKVEPFTFEEVILYAFSQLGYKVTVRHRYTCDGGIDGRVEKNHERYFIQAKRYKGYVRRQDVENFCVLCHTYRAKGFFITTGRLSNETRDIIERDRSVTLIDSRNMSDLFIKKQNSSE